MVYEIRPFEEADMMVLARIYRDAIRHLGGQYYSPAQVAAWSSFPDDAAAFRRWITGATTFVAVDEHGKCVGFGGLQPHARISALFVAPDAVRRGVGTALVQRLFAEINNRGWTEVTTEASEFSRALFEKFGFTVAHVEHTEVRGVAMTRYAMKCRR